MHLEVAGLGRELAKGGGQLEARREEALAAEDVP